MPLPGWKLVRAGKVRDIYRPEGSSSLDVLLFVTSDRVSALDRRLEPPIPGKGRELTLQSRWWIGQLKTRTDVHRVPPASQLPPVPEDLGDRSTIAWRLNMVPVECVVRGYLVGSAWADYAATGRVGGRKLRSGLRFGDALDEPIFTPTTKAGPGDSDEPLTMAEFAARFDTLASELEQRSLAAYREAEAISRNRALSIADVKFEFGIEPDRGALLLADEAVTGDSSRTMRRSDWECCRIRFFGKELIREWLRKTTPASTNTARLPQQLVDDAARSYRALTAALLATG